MKPLARKGRVPIAKNITVLDPSGAELTPTYSRRAQGLVRQGRAVYVHETAIRLVAGGQLTKEEPPMTTQYMEESSAITAQDILQRIDRILNDMSAMEAIQAMISTMDKENATHGEGMKMQALAEIVGARERTNREILCFLREMYDNQ